MSPTMVMSAGENRRDDSLENSYNFQKGVKHMCENGIKHVPNKYILPASERPNVVTETTAISGHNLKLPVIDFAQLQGPNRSHVLESLARACENYGFFQVRLVPVKKSRK